jgi:hypothetical protein
MTIGEHHEWVAATAKTLHMGGDMLWHVFCAAWAANCLTPFAAKELIDPIREALIPKP